MKKLRFATMTAAIALVASMASAEDIKVGVSVGEHAEIMEQVVPVAKEKGLNIDLVEFTDYVMPNQALADGDLNANIFQHKPYLDQQITDRGYDLSPIGLTFTTPMGAYSEKLKSLGDLPEGGKVAIPNDPTNGGRALLLLADKGVITLKDGVGLTPSPLDIVDNAKKLEFLELDAAQLPRSLADADIAIINTNFALEADLDPNTDAIAIENAEGPYANLIVVKTADKDAEWAKLLVESYHHPRIRAFIAEKYKGSVIPAF